MKVYAPSRDEWAWTLRPNLYHEHGYTQQVPERRMDQARLLPPRILLLSIRVGTSRLAFKGTSVVI